MKRKLTTDEVLQKVGLTARQVRRMGHERETLADRNEDKYKGVNLSSRGLPLFKMAGNIFVQPFARVR